MGKQKRPLKLLNKKTLSEQQFDENNYYKTDILLIGFIL